MLCTTFKKCTQPAFAYFCLPSPAPINVRGKQSSTDKEVKDNIWMCGCRCQLSVDSSLVGIIMPTHTRLPLLLLLQLTWTTGRSFDDIRINYVCTHGCHLGPKNSRIPLPFAQVLDNTHLKHYEGGCINHRCIGGFMHKSPRGRFQGTYWGGWRSRWIKELVHPARAAPPPPHHKTY